MKTIRCNIEAVVGHNCDGKDKITNKNKVL